MDKIDLEMQYTPKEWVVYELEIHGEYKVLKEILSSKEEVGLILCGSDSEVAKGHFERTGSVKKLFFFDTEQILMNLDKCYGTMGFGGLTQEWRGHPVGSLVFVVAKGVEEGNFTVGVAKAS